MSFFITTEADAQTGLGYFNAFHDSFIRRLSLVSYDEFTSKEEQQCTGELDVVLLFVHHNYNNGEPSQDQLVEMTFHGVKRLSIGLEGNAAEWTVHHVSIGESLRSSENNNLEMCFEARVVQPHFTNDRQWTYQDVISFTFRDGAIHEVESA